MASRNYCGQSQQRVPSPESRLGNLDSSSFPPTATATHRLRGWGPTVSHIHPGLTKTHRNTKKRGDVMSWKTSCAPKALQSR